MKFSDAIDQFFVDMRMHGRINSPKTERAYRDTLNLHADDVDNRDPRYTNRDDVKRTLGRWNHQNTVYKHRAVLVSFYRWAMWEGIRKDNPAEQVMPPKKVPVDVYRMTFDEVRRFLDAPTSRRERWLAWVGVLAGPRRQELIGFQGRHFQREGFIWVSRDIGKGGRERFLPILDDLVPIVYEIRATIGLDEYVFPAQRWRNPTAMPGVKKDLKTRPASEQAIWRAVRNIAKAAGIYGNVTPHSMRHAFGDHIARGTGDVRVAQFLLGHADLGTTETYLDAPTLDQLARAVKGFTFWPERRDQERAEASAQLMPVERMFYPRREVAGFAGVASSGLEPVESASSGVPGEIGEWLTEILTFAGQRGGFYREAFGAV